jgi:hypothetical protein
MPAREAVYPALMRPARRIGGLRHLLPVAICGLAGHLALWRSLTPSTGDHAYFFWYEPLVAGLSVAALALLAGLLLAATAGGASMRRRAVSLLPSASRTAPGTVRAVRLALASLAFLACQETIERSLGEGRLAPAAFGSSQLLLVLGAVAAAAAIVAIVERSCSRLIAYAARVCVPRARPLSVLLQPARPFAVRRRNPLAELRGLRAPPLPV